MKGRSNGPQATKKAWQLKVKVLKQGLQIKVPNLIKVKEGTEVEVLKP